jgi:capsular exopolysaccharide synthesis family protein
VAQPDGQGFDLRSYLRTLHRRRWLIALVTVGVVACALVVSLLQSKVYRASAEVVLQPRSTESVFDPSNTTGNNRTVETEIRVLRSDDVRNAVRREIGSAPPVTAARVGETEAMKISAASPDAQRAARIANAYASAYIELRKNQAVGDLKAASDQIGTKITALQGQIDALDKRLASAAPAERAGVEATIGPRYTSLLTEQSLLSQKLDSLQVDATLKSGGVQLVSEARPPTSPASPKPLRNALAAAVVGLVLGVALAFVREHLDDSVRNKDDLARALPGIPVLGVVPLNEDWDWEHATAQLEMVRTGSTPAAEALRTLRTAIQLLGVERPLHTLQITSPAAREGKSTLLANLAVVLAASGQRVVMLDCDLRRPSLHELFGVPDDVGFTSIFLGDATAQEVVQKVDIGSSLFLVTSGPIPANPSELLGSGRTAQFIFDLQSEYDIVLVDSAPVLPVADAVVLAAWVEATLMVAAAGATTRGALADAFERMRHVDARVVGSVLNRATVELGYSYGQRYGYGPQANGRGRASKASCGPSNVAPDHPARQPVLTAASRRHGLSHGGEVRLLLVGPAVGLCLFGGSGDESAGPRRVVVEPADGAGEIVGVAADEPCEARVIEVRLGRGGARRQHRPPHRHEVVHLVAVGQVPEHVRFDRHHPGVGPADGGHQLLDRNVAGAEPDPIGDAQVVREAPEGLPLGAVAVDLKDEVGDVGGQEGDGADDGVDAVALLERAVAHEDELVAPVRARGRLPVGVEHSLVGGVEDDLDVLGPSPSGHERRPHLLGAGDGAVGVADGGLLDPTNDPDGGMLHADAELGGEELRKALVEVEKHASAQRPGHDGGEGERVRQGVHLHHPVAPAGVQARRQNRGRHVEQEVLGHVAGDPAAAVPQRDAVDAQPSVPLDKWFAPAAGAQHIHFVSGVKEREHLAPHSWIEREAPLAQDEHGLGAR